MFLTIVLAYARPALVSWLGRVFSCRGKGSGSGPRGEGGHCRKTLQPPAAPGAHAGSCQRDGDLKKRQCRREACMRSGLGLRWNTRFPGCCLRFCCFRLDSSFFRVFFDFIGQETGFYLRVGGQCSRRGVRMAFHRPGLVKRRSVAGFGLLADAVVCQATSSALSSVLGTNTMPVLALKSIRPA